MSDYNGYHSEEINFEICSEEILNNPELGSPTNKVGDLNFYKQIEELKEKSKINSTIRELGEESVSNGYIQRFGFINNLGHTYDAAIGIPLHRQITDIPVIQTSAWFTSSRGHNEHTIRNFVNNGVPFIFVGPEGSYRDKKCKILTNYEIKMADSAAAVLNFSEQITKDFPYNIDPVKRVVIGESRGAMVGMGIIALAKTFNQDVIFSDLVAPCFPRKIEPRDLLKLSGHILSEPKSIIKLAGSIGLSPLVHYPSTIDVHPYAVTNQIAIGPALFSGEAGEMAKLIPKDKIIHITCFNDDFASMPNEWKKIFKGNPNVRITLLEGSHLTIADPETLQFILSRNISLNMELENNNAELDGQRIFDRAHELI